MGLKRLLKKKIIVAQMKKRNQQNPFDKHVAENYQLPDNTTPLDTNSYYFSAHDLEGNSLFLRKAIRGDKTVEIWFVYKTPQAIYVNTQQLYDNDNTPISLECLEDAKKWTFNYNGPVNLATSDHELVAQREKAERTAKIKGIFTATSDIFDFTHDLNPELMGRALAKEKWNDTFLKNMRENQQVHYEQQGTIKADIEIDGKKIKFEASAMRDHSFGKRDWNYMNRHIWLMALLGNGEALNLNMVNYPHMKNLQTGYYEVNNQATNIDEVVFVEGFNPLGHVPNQIKYDIILENGHSFGVEASKEVEILFQFDHGNYTICEGIATFNINGYKARGIIEFGFNRDRTRW